jgi:hypothetical protein
MCFVFVVFVILDFYHPESILKEQARTNKRTNEHTHTCNCQFMDYIVIGHLFVFAAIIDNDMNTFESKWAHPVAFRLTLRLLIP